MMDVTQALTLAGQAMVLAQSNDASKWAGPVVLLVIVVAVILLSMASRKNADAPEVDRPKATQDKPIDPKRQKEIKQHTTDIDELREKGFDPDKIEAILAKAPEKRTMAEVKMLNLAKKASPGLEDRKTAVEQTEEAQEEHAALDEAAATEEADVSDEVPAEPSTDVADASAEDDVPSEPEVPKATEPEPVAAAAADKEEPAKEDDGTSYKDGLKRTKEGFSSKFYGLFKGKAELDDDLRDAIEEFLYTSDIGVKAATRIMDTIDTKVKDEVKRDPEKLWAFVREFITHEMLEKRQNKLDVEAHEPFVMLVIGVNGAGKTTTIGKLASRYKRQGKSVLVVAGDTFRAAAVEQLQVWADRVGVPLHKGKSEADPASVVYDGIERGVAEGVDIIICDTSGRLQTDVKLMDELKKVRRVSGKALEGAPHETVLVLDANQGQNAVVQARTFNDALDISGIILTKLDGTARGGVILGIGEELDVPVRYVGIGEGIKDLREFDATEFAEALFL